MGRRDEAPGRCGGPSWFGDHGSETDQNGLKQSAWTYARRTSQSLCLIQQLRFIVPIVVGQAAADSVTLAYTIEAPDLEG